MKVDTATSPPLMDVPERSVRRAGLELFLISFVILFFELACIRWFASTVVFLTFFTNLVLMACFLGMTVGCLTASRRQTYINSVIPLTFFTVALAIEMLWAYAQLGRVQIDVGGQDSPQQVFFGTEYGSNDPSYFFVPIEVVAGVFYVLIALMFIGLGQVMGRAFSAIPNRVAAYMLNILGSLVGIAAFSLASSVYLPPSIWFGASLALVLYFVPNWKPIQVYGSIGTLLVLAMLAYRENEHGHTIWSPYYKVQYFPQNRAIATNNLGHQDMVPIGQSGPAYALPHLLSRDAGFGPFQDVLIIGAGSGNDVQSALAHGAKRVDAVEIDPVLYEIGRVNHPDRPYDDPRVTIHLDDGRNFLRKTNRTYDLIVYALVDSLVLHSGYSSLRLESFLFTRQALRDVRAKLKPGGVFVMYNYYRQGWVVGRLAKMAEEEFGFRPIVISLPYQAQIAASDNQYGYFNFLLVGHPGTPRLAAIRSAIQDKHAFWMHKRPRQNEPLNAYGAEPPAVPGTKRAEWQKITPAAVDISTINLIPTDDWPFLYLREASIPSLNLRWILLVGILSLAILFAFAPLRTIRVNWQMFFLGAGFMLLETKGIVHMALLFGSTWIVNSIVSFAILLLILLSNLFVLAAKPSKSWPFYGFLIAALVVNTYVPMSKFLSLPGPSQVIASCVVVFLPIFFAGIIFAIAFRTSTQPEVDFASNIAGVILGGLSEFCSLVVGFNHLLFIAIAFYLLSALLRGRLKVSLPAAVP